MITILIIGCSANNIASTWSIFRRVGGTKTWVCFKFQFLVIQTANLLFIVRKKHEKAGLKRYYEWDSWTRTWKHRSKKNNIHICESNFKEEYIENFSKRKSLQTGSIPTENLPVKSLDHLGASFTSAPRKEPAPRDVSQETTILNVSLDNLKISEKRFSDNLRKKHWVNNQTLVTGGIHISVCLFIRSHLLFTKNWGILAQCSYLVQELWDPTETTLNQEQGTCLRTLSHWFPEPRVSWIKTGGLLSCLMRWRLNAT